MAVARGCKRRIAETVTGRKPPRQARPLLRAEWTVPIIDGDLGPIAANLVAYELERCEDRGHMIAQRLGDRIAQRSDGRENLGCLKDLIADRAALERIGIKQRLGAALTSLGQG